MGRERGAGTRNAVHLHGSSGRRGVQRLGNRPRPAPADSGRAPRGRARILAVDDEPQILRLVRNTLSDAGYTPIVTGDPDEALHLIEQEKPHLILLDMVLPGTDGIELMRRIPEITDAPVIFLAGHGGDEIVARAFEAGADDYMVKPFSPTELAARIEAVLRRRSASDRIRAREPYVLGDLTVNYAERRVTVAGRPVRLTATEYKLLFELSINAGRVLTHDQLLGRVWGPGLLRRLTAPTLLRQEASRQAEGRRQQPQIHLHRASRRLPHGKDLARRGAWREAAARKDRRRHDRQDRNR